MTDKDNSMPPIEIHSNGEEAAADRNNSNRAFRTGSYKPSISIGKPLKRQRKLTSTVWQYYEFIDPDVDGNVYCKCKKCGKIYPGESKNGTGNLLRHLSKCKKRHVRDICQLLLHSNSSSLTSKVPKFQAEIFRGLLALCVVKHDLPFLFAEYDGVRDLFSYLNPEVKFFSRKTTKCDVLKLYKNEKEKLKVFLQNNSGRVAFTSDCWTSLNTNGFISLTAHYIDENWELHKKILNFSFMPPPHNGVSLAEKFCVMLKDWGVEKKVMTLTLDNATSNDYCVQVLKSQLKLFADGDFFHVRCCAHILNLIVKDGLKELDEAVFKVRECVKYCKGSQARKQRFLDTCSFCDIIYNKGLRQDVPTRWNSTYLMLESALYYKKLFFHLAVIDSNFINCPSCHDWIKIEKICAFLKVFYEVTCAFSSSKYPTANLYFPNVVRVRLVLKDEINNGDSMMKAMAGRKFLKFEKYWSEVSTIMAFAVILDPRYKLHFAEWTFRRVYGDNYKCELSLLKTKLVSLYDEYEKCLTSSQSASFSSPSQVSHTAQAVHDSYMEYFSSLHLFLYIWDFDEYSSTVCVSNVKSELELYLDEIKLPRAMDFDVLGFWKSNPFRFPVLSQLARDILIIPLSTVASESAFSVGGRVLDAYRTSLKPETTEAIICLRDWVFGQAIMHVQEDQDTSLVGLCGDVMKMNLNEDDSVETSQFENGTGESNME